jgi:hypothetical protein
MLSGRKTQLVLVLLTVVLLCSFVSHVAVRRFQIYADYSVPQPYGGGDNKGPIILDGSSLAYSGIDWNEVSARMGSSITSWATAGSSPAEWEIQNRRSPNTTCAFVVISAYDLNEYWLCDFRADIVPFSQTVSDLRHSGVGWSFSKRILSQYPVMLVRKIFPTVGRSDGVMTGIRDMVKSWLDGGAAQPDSEATAFTTGPEAATEKLSEWPEGRLQRRLVLMKEKCQGKHAFNGPKELALIRLLEQASRQGTVKLIVVPVSPIYQKEFLDAKTMGAFEQTISDIETRFPQAQVIRLDHLPSLDDDSLFKDLVHLNANGQRIATADLLQHLDKQVTQR